jgi:hypothetical protein
VDDDRAAVTDYQWWIFGTGLAIGVVIGLCLGVVAVLLADPKE